MDKKATIDTSRFFSWRFAWISKFINSVLVITDFVIVMILEISTIIRWTRFNVKDFNSYSLIFIINLFQFLLALELVARLLPHMIWKVVIGILLKVWWVVRPEQQIVNLTFLIWIIGLFQIRIGNAFNYRSIPGDPYDVFNWLLTLINH